MAETLIFVAFYQHAYGTEVFVYPSEAEALAQRDALARENWADAFPREPMPKQVGAVYFGRLSALDNAGAAFFAIHPTWCDLSRFATGASSHPVPPGAGEPAVGACGALTAP